MSQENMQLVRSICAAWDRGEYGSVAWAHPADIEFSSSTDPNRALGRGWPVWLRVGAPG